MQGAKPWKITINAIGDWWDDNCLRLAAALAFYTALSLAPLVLFIVALVGLVIDRQAAATQLAAQLESLMGSAGGEPVQTILSRVLEFFVSVLVLTPVFAVLFKYVPDAQIAWHDVWLGGCVSALLFTLGKTAMGYYIGHASVGSAYGAAGSFVVLLVWV